MSLKDSMDPRIEELLPFYALDALNDEERELVESYLAEHPEAREQINDLHSGASALPYGISPVEPPRHVKESLMVRVNADAKARARSRERRSRPSFLSFLNLMNGENILRTFTLGVATLAIVWIMILNTKISHLQSEISGLHDTLAAQSNSLEQIIANLPKSPPSNVITVSLKGTDVQPRAHGQLIADPKEQSAVLIITGLPKLEAKQTYQVWLISGGKPVSAGLLSIDANGQGVVIVTSDESIGSFNSLGISVEPEGGSPQPTGDIVVLSDI
jgi:anti-sigma-K factor RskA